MLKCKSDGKLVITLSVSLLSSYACDPAGCKAARERTKLGFISRSGYRSQAVTIVFSPFLRLSRYRGPSVNTALLGAAPALGQWGGSGVWWFPCNETTHVKTDWRDPCLTINEPGFLSSWDTPRGQLFIKLFLKLVLCAAPVNGSGLNGWKPK